MTIRAGDLQARLTVTGTVLEDRPDGGQDEVTVTVLENYAAQVVPIAATEQLRGSGQIATATYRAHLRQPYDAAGHVIVLTPAMEASARHGYTGQVQAFQIVSVTDVDGRGRELELLLAERVT